MSYRSSTPSIVSDGSTYYWKVSVKIRSSALHRIRHLNINIIWDEHTTCVAAVRYMVVHSLPDGYINYCWEVAAEYDSKMDSLRKHRQVGAMPGIPPLVFSTVPNLGGYKDMIAAIKCQLTTFVNWLADSSSVKGIDISY